jgi:hypothetical protein
MSDDKRSTTGDVEMKAAQALTTKVLAIGSWTAKATPETRPPVMPFEARDTLRLQLARQDRSVVRQDRRVRRDEYCASIETTGVPPYVVQHLRGAMADYQKGHMSGPDNNIEKLTGRRSMTVGEFAHAHADVLNGPANQ